MVLVFLHPPVVVVRWAGDEELRTCFLHSEHHLFVDVQVRTMVNGHPVSPLFGAIKFDARGPGVQVVDGSPVETPYRCVHSAL